MTEFSETGGTVPKPGRNDPCACGSGKKYKRCCLSRPTDTDAEALARLQEQLIEGARKERRRIEEYGYVRPVISTVFKGTRFVAVGSTLHYSSTWKTVPDFLFDYLKRVLGSDWGTNEIKTKPLEERHPILQWYDSVCRFQRRHEDTRTKDGLYSGVMDGPTAAYLLLAYDLYVLADHQKLQDRIVHRLKHPHLFQGARYELAVATHCIRAGFEIEHEDELDKSTKHPEFTATHKRTEQVIAVEAKSRHRPGVLGRPGEREEQPSAGVRRVLKQAISKSPEQPYAIFVDLNLPPTEATDVREIPWLKELLREIGKSPEEEQTPYNLLMFTNRPQHYGAEAAPNPGSDRVSAISLNPKAPVEHPEALKALHEAALQYGRIPNWFEE